MQDMQETQSDIMRTFEEIPTQAYMGFAFGSMLLSAFMFLIGRRSTALFLGQWPPTVAIMAMCYKLLRPSHERPYDQMRSAGEQMSETARDIGSRVGR